MLDYSLNCEKFYKNVLNLRTPHSALIVSLYAIPMK